MTASKLCSDWLGLLDCLCCLCCCVCLSALFCVVYFGLIMMMNSSKLTNPSPSKSASLIMASHSSSVNLSPRFNIMFLLTITSSFFKKASSWYRMPFLTFCYTKVLLQDLARYKLPREIMGDYGIVGNVEIAFFKMNLGHFA